MRSSSYTFRSPFTVTRDGAVEAIACSSWRQNISWLWSSDGMRIAYASPNAISALHRMGISSNVEGVRFDELGNPRLPVVRCEGFRSVDDPDGPGPRDAGSPAA